MNIVNFEKVSIGFGGELLLDSVNFRVNESERIGLIGRNGMGKTSLMKLILGELSQDEGIISRQQDLRIAYLPQEVPQGLSGSIKQIVHSGLEGMTFDWQPEETEWQADLLVQQTLSRMQLDSETQFDVLSAGMKRRVLLAKGLVAKPQLLLLDEPTNHLDIQSILWLEDFLLRWKGSIIFVTHDRLFLQALANRIVELDRGRIFDWDCDYRTFMQRKEAFINAEQTQNDLFDRKLAQEEQWIRKGIEARRTRNEGRVRALLKLRDIRKERREKPGKVKLQIQEARQSGKLVVETKDISFRYSDDWIIKDFSFILQRGDKLGIVGPNGSGKTTLVNLLLGNLLPQQGLIELGTNLECVYFDQLRAQLDENQTLYENVAQGRDTVNINGVNRNVYGYLEDFLFPKERVHAPIHVLSGGERNRLLLARLFTMPANLIILDEPTNDLDLETLELLENILLEFTGTIIIVSHDRAFLNNLVTSTLVLDGNGKVSEYIGGYEDWYQLTDNQQPAIKPDVENDKTDHSKISLGVNAQNPKTINLYQRKKLQSEMDSLPEKIETLESEYHATIEKMSSSDFYNQRNEAIIENTNRLKWLEAEIAHTYQRWQEIEHILDDIK